MIAGQWGDVWRHADDVVAGDTKSIAEGAVLNAYALPEDTEGMRVDSLRTAMAKPSKPEHQPMQLSMPLTLATTML